MGGHSRETSVLGRKVAISLRSQCAGNACQRLVKQKPERGISSVPMAVATGARSPTIQIDPRPTSLWPAILSPTIYRTHRPPLNPVRSRGHYHNHRHIAGVSVRAVEPMTSGSCSQPSSKRTTRHSVSSCRPQLNRHQQRRSQVITNRPHRVAISTGRSLTTTASRPVTDVGATNPPPGTMTFSTRYPLDYQSVFIDSCVGYSLASSGGRSPCSSRRAMSRTNKRTCRTRSSRSLYA